VGGREEKGGGKVKGGDRGYRAEGSERERGGRVMSGEGEETRPLVIGTALRAAKSQAVSEQTELASRCLLRLPVDVFGSYMQTCGTLRLWPQTMDTVVKLHLLISFIAPPLIFALEQRSSPIRICGLPTIKCLSSARLTPTYAGPELPRAAQHFLEMATLGRDTSTIGPSLVPSPPGTRGRLISLEIDQKRSEICVRASFSRGIGRRWLRIRLGRAVDTAGSIKWPKAMSPFDPPSLSIADKPGLCRISEMVRLSSLRATTA